MKKSVFSVLWVSLVLILSACKKDNSINIINSNAPGDNHVSNRIDPPVGGICLGNLTKYLFVFTNGSVDANWQGATKGFIGDVAINGMVAKERTSGAVPYAGTLYTNAATNGSWQNILNQNTSQSHGSTGEVARISGLTSNLDDAFNSINAMSPSAGYEAVSSTSLNGLNTQNGIADFIVINITSGLQVSSKINITGDAVDVFILRWDTDADPSNGYQGITKFQSGGAIVPNGDLKVSNFINVAGDISSSGGGSNPASPYPQGPRDNDGLGNLIINGANFNGGGFFTGYWLTTGDPVTGETHSLSNAIFVGGWYTSSKKFSLTSGTSGVYVSRGATEICGNGIDDNCDGQIDENCIPSVTICDQTWMLKNLDVSTYRNGDPIPNVTDPAEWASLTTGAFRWANNDSATYGPTYGRLYNWYAVNDPRGLGPAGWHIPSHEEWYRLITCIDPLAHPIESATPSSIVGGEMKETGTTHWISPNFGATNNSGFTALPGGFYNGSISPTFVGSNGLWWDSNETVGSPTNGDIILLFTVIGSIRTVSANKSYGLSVRCVKD